MKLLVRVVAFTFAWAGLITCTGVSNEPAKTACAGGICANVCSEGDEQPCYAGPAGTEGVGPCRGGTQVCHGGQWSACSSIGPIPEDCDNGVDDDCNGLIDDSADDDGDGFGVCDGDCCDSTTVCDNPAAVGPSAIDVAADGFDNDCDGQVDNQAGSCDEALVSDSDDPADYARALGLCRSSTEASTSPGLISAHFSRADGVGSPAPGSHSLRSAFGAVIAPLEGDSMVVLSTGNAAAPGDVAPSYEPWQVGVTHGTYSDPPEDWLDGNGGELPNAPGCPDISQGRVYDPVMLSLRLRVPQNASSFSLRFNFMSSEYPEWVCSPYNDFFVVLLDSEFAGAPANPADKNLAVYTAPDAKAYPVGVNLAYGNTGLFSQCENGQTGCAGGEAVVGSTSACTGIDQLAGTGMDQEDPEPYPESDATCGSNDLLGGGTGWLETRGNVVPGEVITLRIAVWDTGDATMDSVVILDRFEWHLEATNPGTGEVVE